MTSKAGASRRRCAVPAGHLVPSALELVGFGSEDEPPSPKA
ncbi:hypothetical protein [Nocardia salmonicida]|nr:hypothetical protein [Nocardia salmonicida]